MTTKLDLRRLHLGRGRSLLVPTVPVYLDDGLQLYLDDGRAVMIPERFAK